MGLQIVEDNDLSSHSRCFLPTFPTAPQHHPPPFPQPAAPPQTLWAATPAPPPPPSLHSLLRSTPPPGPPNRRPRSQTPRASLSCTSFLKASRCVEPLPSVCAEIGILLALGDVFTTRSTTRYRHAFCAKIGVLLAFSGEFSTRRCTLGSTSLTSIVSRLPATRNLLASSSKRSRRYLPRPSSARCFPAPGGILSTSWWPLVWCSVAVLSVFCYAPVANPYVRALSPSGWWAGDRS